MTMCTTYVGRETIYVGTHTWLLRRKFWNDREDSGRRGRLGLPDCALCVKVGQHKEREGKKGEVRRVCVCPSLLLSNGVVVASVLLGYREREGEREREKEREKEPGLVV